MTSPTETCPCSSSCCRSSTASASRLLLRHVDGATLVADYDFNNTYQYVIAREETHV